MFRRPPSPAGHISYIPSLAILRPSSCPRSRSDNRQAIAELRGTVKNQGQRRIGWGPLGLATAATFVTGAATANVRGAVHITVLDPETLSRSEVGPLSFAYEPAVSITAP